MGTTQAVSLGTVTMKSGAQKIKLLSPYHPALPERARKLGGTFGGETKAWYFDPRDGERVRQMTLDIYGIDPLADASATAPWVTVRIDLDIINPQNADLWLAGREIANRPFRDAAVRLGEKVVVISGGFRASGGSARNPWLAPREGTILEVRDLPMPAVEQAEARYAAKPGAITRVTDEAAAPTVPTLLDQTKALIGQMTPAQRADLVAWLMAPAPAPVAQAAASTEQPAIALAATPAQPGITYEPRDPRF